MSAIRTFIAVNLPLNIKEKISGILDDLSALNTGIVRWVPPENIHLTIKFIGDISPKNLEVLCRFLQSETKHHNPFSLCIGQLGTFPNNQYPRVIWIGIKATKELHLLHKGIEAQASRLGYAAEQRAYSPHLTIGRVSRNAKNTQIRVFAEKLQDVTVGELGRMEVDRISVFRSDLQPSGAVYTPIKTFELT
jgi:2'-5' RNA ligase